MNSRLTIVHTNVFIHLYPHTIVVIECGEVPSLENGKVLVAPNNTEVGAVATYECETGYEFKDSRNTRICQNDMTWSNEDIECSIGMYIENIYSNRAPTLYV